MELSQQIGKTLATGSELLLDQSSCSAGKISNWRKRCRTGGSRSTRVELPLADIRVHDRHMDVNGNRSGRRKGMKRNWGCCR